MLGSVDANTGDAQTGESLAFLKLQNASSSFTLSFLHLYIVTCKKKERWLWCCHRHELWGSSWSGYKSICNSETGITRIRGALKTTVSFQRRNTLNGCRQASLHLSISFKSKPLASHIVGWKYLVHPDTLTMVEWSIGGRVHPKSSVRKAFESEYYSCLRRLNLGVSMGSGFRPWD